LEISMRKTKLYRFDTIQGPNVSKVDIVQVKTRDKQVKDVDHKEKCGSIAERA